MAIKNSTPSSRLPTGTVTFLFTDIEGSTRLSQQYAADMPAMLDRHNAILNEAVKKYNGYTFQIVGDSYTVAFHTATEALLAALEMQRSLLQEQWSPAAIKVRMGLHTGAAELQDPSQALRYSGYATIALSQRIMSAGHGGQILLSQTSADLLSSTLPPNITLINLGQKRLRDIMHPVQLYQLAGTGLPKDFPPLKTVEAIHNNLPRGLTPFIGREEELAALKELMADKTRRLITLIAPGGMGKTRLSLEAAGQMVEVFPQGLYFIALDDINSADRIVQEVAESLPITLSSKEDPKTRIIEYLRDKKILLLMDNFEHVLDGAGLVQDILTEAPRTQILVTSRLRLNLMSETLFVLSGLEVNGSTPQNNSAVQLFVQSARRTQPQFQLSEAVLPSVTRICRLVEGMPLAIVLAAAWLDTLTVQEIADEISSSIDILETDVRDIPGRQRSIRAVIESSWNQVDPKVQDLLQRLSVFRGGFTREAAQKAAGASIRGLSQLVDKVLIRRDMESGRYSIHELVRQYAAEQLAALAENEHSAIQTHAQYYANFMSDREEKLHDHHQKAALRDIEDDIENIREAWSYWTEQQNAGHLRQFLGGMWLYFEIRGAFSPAIQFFGDAARQLKNPDPDTICVRAEIEARQAWFTALIGLPEDGLRIALHVLEMLQKYNNVDISVETLHCVTINAIFLNQNDLVLEITQKMLARAERSGDVWERGWALIWWAYALIIRQIVDEAIKSGEEALKIFNRLQNPFGSSVASAIILGTISMVIGNMAQAKVYFIRGKEAAESIQYYRLQQICYDNLGSVALMEGDLDLAHQFFLQSLRISEGSGQAREMLASLRDLSQIYLARGELQQALKLTAVVLNHPASTQNSLNRPEPLRGETEKLRQQIAAQLEPQQYESAWGEGQEWHLAEIVNQLLA